MAYLSRRIEKGDTVIVRNHKEGRDYKADVEDAGDTYTLLDDGRIYWSADLKGKYQEHMEIISFASLWEVRGGGVQFFKGQKQGGPT